MSERKISYLSRGYEDYKKVLMENIKKYYPQISNDFDDASIGTWLVEMVASIADNLSYHIDRVFNETNINSAQKTSSIYSIARSNGLKVTGAKGAMTEVEISCELPIVGSNDTTNNDSSTLGMPNWAYAPIIKKGSRVASSNQIFELMNDVDFSEAFNNDGYSNRVILPKVDSNGRIVAYKITKKEVVIAGESRVYKQVLTNDNIKPFMELIIPDSNVMNVESILFKDGTNFTVNPSISEFSQQEEFVPAEYSKSGVDTYRYFEVDSLIEQYRWGEVINKEGNESEEQNKKVFYGYYDETNNVTLPVAHICKGEWKPLTQKFITEFTDKGYLKIIFGCGEQVGQNVDIGTASDFSKAQITRMVRNNFLGKLPSGGWTMFVLYRSGGGAASNIAKGAINSFTYLNVDIARNSNNPTELTKIIAVKNSITVTNTIPSVSGKDSPSIDEIRAMVKYNNGAQERCVTINDYMDRIMKMPPKYGCPYRVNVIELNNKIAVYILGIDYNGKLTDEMPEMLTSNMQNYLAMYRMINDYVDIEAGKIINLSFEADIYVDKNYNSSDVISDVIKVINSYMDTNKHQLGEDIFIGDIQKEISKTDGVLNLIDFRVYNEIGNGYSSNQISQEVIQFDEEEIVSGDDNRIKIDLKASDYILNADADSMFEIKYPEKDIRIMAKIR